MGQPIRRSAIAAGILLGTTLGAGLFAIDYQKHRQEGELQSPHGLDTHNLLAPFAASDSNGESGDEGDSTPLASYFKINMGQPDHHEARTLSGAFLSSLFAQRRQRWNEAADYIEDMRAFNGDNGHSTVILKKSLILEMGANNPKEAIAIARAYLKQPDDDYNSRALASLFAAIGAFKDGNYSQAHKDLAAMPDDGLTLFLKPIIQGWLDSVDGKRYEALDRGHHIHMLSAAYIADYLDKPARVKALLDQLMRFGDLPFQAQEKIADIYYVNGYKTVAGKIYDSLKKVIPTSVRLDAKVAAKKSSIPVNMMLYQSPKTAHEGLSFSIYQMASMLHNDGAYDSARLFVNMALYLNPELSEAQLLQADISAEFDNIAAALSGYGQISKDSPQYGKAQMMAAELYGLEDEPDKAIKILRSYYNESSDIQALLQIGDTQRRNKRFADALHSYNLAIERHLDGDVPQGYWFLYNARGQVHERLGNWDDAKTDLEKALNYSPENPYVLNYLGYAMADRGLDLERALNMLKKAIALEPDDGAITDSLGWAHYRVGDYKQAVPYLERASELMPSDAVINDHLGDAYWQVGRKLEARYQWKRAKQAKDVEPALKAAIEKKLDHGLQNIDLIVRDNAHNDSDKKRHANMSGNTAKSDNNGHSATDAQQSSMD